VMETVSMGKPRWAATTACPAGDFAEKQSRPCGASALHTAPSQTRASSTAHRGELTGGTLLMVQVY
jgi:hypothetical protein